MRGCTIKVSERIDDQNQEQVLMSAIAIVYVKNTAGAAFMSCEHRSTTMFGHRPAYRKAVTTGQCIAQGVFRIRPGIKESDTVVLI